ncbi:MAG: hypothetical protein QM737_15215 [Ferruginibacter sp.]
MKALINKISISLKKDGSDKNCRAWANFIVKNKIAITDLHPLIHAEHPVAMRFSWLLGGICESNPKLVYPSIIYFFSNRDKIEILNFNRSLAKMFCYCGVPDEIEGEAMDNMFKWLSDPKSIVSTKNFAMSALYNFTIKYPELKNELRTIIEEQLDKNSLSFQKQARKLLEKL